MLLLWDIDLTLLDPHGFGRRVVADVFAACHGRAPTVQVPFAGRTDRAIVTDLLAANGAAADDAAVRGFQDAFAAESERRRDEFRAGGGGPLPGALAVLELARSRPGITQGVLTGNMRRTGVLKLAEAGLLDRLDLGISAFGDAHEVRADLVDVARGLAAAAGISAPGAGTVLVGDTPDDMLAARARGATAVGITTGHFTASALSSAGAHAVVPDLRDPAAVLDVIEATVRRRAPVPREPE